MGDLGSDHPTAWAELCILVGDPKSPHLHHRKSIDEAMSAFIKCLEQNGQRKDDAVRHFQDMIASWVRNAS